MIVPASRSCTLCLACSGRPKGLLLKVHDGGAVEALLVVLAFAERLGDPVPDLRWDLHPPDYVLKRASATVGPLSSAGQSWRSPRDKI